MKDELLRQFADRGRVDQVILELLDELLFPGSRVGDLVDGPRTLDANLDFPVDRSHGFREEQGQ